MAERPVFSVNIEHPYYREERVQFQYAPGFSIVQKLKNIQSIHNEYSRLHHNARILEVSSKSDLPLGVQLSAFNLALTVGGVRTTVESAFQASKVFQLGGPYADLLGQPSYIAKKDQRLRESGALRSFELSGTPFPLEPKTFFYDWIYINALQDNNELSEQISEYNAFTDIEFNPEKSINCQARSAAIYVSLRHQGLLSEALLSPDHFLHTVYLPAKEPDHEQLSFF